ncbi:MAG: ABC transporter ATP-binding protein [Sediminibacterium sp.]|nr:ABC transporter ATP-binding protein [Sediminibacterium sp.]MBX9778918.1 ABC transporter ATP-binding protein [Chitinophagaceae bacterium]
MANPIISIKQVYKNYGYKEVLKNINLDIDAGQVIGYIGPNGAGKSTTVKILCGLISDYDGTVLVNGINLKENPIAVKKMIGYVPELAELYDVLTPLEFLGLMANLYEIDEAIATERIHKMMQAFGLSDNINQRMDTFSKGMKQKVLISSGLLHNPEIIILDEPLSGLDANSVIIVKELINRLAKEGKTIFYCSHMMDVVEKVSDRIILINNGEVIADGSFHELQSQQGNKSLEKIFAQLTAQEALSDTADQLIKAFDN